jgi:arsenate reductase (thioredoxin)
MPPPAGSNDQLAQHEIDRIATDLAQRFSGTFTRDEVHEVVMECYRQLAEQATVPAFLPVLAGRMARDRLASRAAGADRTP